MSLCVSLSQRCRARLVLKLLLVLAALEFLYLLVPWTQLHFSPWRLPTPDVASEEGDADTDADSEAANKPGALRLLQSALNYIAADALSERSSFSSNNSLLEHSSNQSESDSRFGTFVTNGRGDSQSESLWHELLRDPCATGNCKLPLCERDSRFGVRLSNLTYSHHYSVDVSFLISSIGFNFNSYSYSYPCK